jgi:peroxiredoxin
MKRGLLAVAVLLTACGGAGVGVPPKVPPTWERPGLGGAVRPEMGSPQPGEAAPELALPDLEGHEVSLASMRGGWVILHFTATWCPFCDSELGHLGELAEAMAPLGVRTVIVDVKEDVGVWHAYARAHAARSVVALHDATGRVSARFAPERAQPSFLDRSEAVLDATLLVDPKGTIRLFLLPDSAHFDPTFVAVRRELERLLAEEPGPPRAPLRPVVDIKASPGTAAAGEHAELRVMLDILPGYHVMSNRPSEPNYVATRVVVEGAPGIVAGEAAYPPPASFALAGRAISTFEGAVEVVVPLEVAPDAEPGPRDLRGTARYQACDRARCLFPVTGEFQGVVVVRRN